MKNRLRGNQEFFLSRIPPPRIKRILQTDEEIGKMANPVPAVIARSLEVFIEKLLTKSVDVTQHRMAKTLTPQHIKECVKLERTFRFLHGVVSTVPDLGADGGHSGNSTVTSGHHGSSSELGSNAGTSSSQRTSGSKRRGSKYAISGECSSSHEGHPPRKLSRRGRKSSNRSREVEDDLDDLSDDGDPSGEDSSDKTSPAKLVAAPNARKAGTHEEIYELGPTGSDDVPDDPSIDSA